MESAAQVALRNPIIVSLILEWIEKDIGGIYRTSDTLPTNHTGDTSCHSCHKCQSHSYRGVLLRCAQINSFWFDFTIPILWRELDRFYPYDTLHSYLRNVDPDRRQIYAGHIREATTMTIDKDERDFLDFRDITFPRLKKLTIMVDNQVHITSGGYEAVEEVCIDPRHELYPDVFLVWADDTEAVLEQVSAIFPNLKNLEFVDFLWAYPDTISKFEALHPNVTVEGSEYLRETS